MNSPDPGEIFRTEAQELLEQLEQALLDLETAPEDGELISSAFRALHTLKGSGAMFGFDAAARFAHGLENAFDLVRKGKVPASGALIGVALSAKDHLRLLIERPEEASPDESARILADLAKTIGGTGTAETAAPKEGKPNEATSDETPSATYRIQIRFPEDVMDNGTNPLLLIGELQDLGICTVSPLTERIPPLDDIKPSACYVGWDVILTTGKPRSAIEEVFIFVIDDMDLRIEKVEETSKRLGEILVERGDTPPDAVLTALSNQQRLGEILVKDGAASKERVASALAEQRHLTAAASQAPQKTHPLQDSIKVPAERLDNLMDRVGELVIAQARLREIATSSQDLALKVVAEEIERLASELRDNTMGIRMVPIGSLFGRFRRLVRDLSRELGKKVQLFTSGEETELDKTMIERLNDPMIHLIRNCIDHGLERPDIRTQSGKHQEGRVELSAVHSGAQVIISIKDDGKGLDRTRIRARAEEMGYLAPGAKVTDNELFQVIFQPGFSTSREVTSVSGRGVGMDVVKRTIEGLRGAIEINSTEGQGTEITLKLPLTLAIIDGLLVRVGRGRYVIPLSMVEECVELTPEQNVRAKNRNFLSIRGELVPFLRLRDMFNVTADADPFPKVVIVSAGDLRVGLLVDQVIGDHQTVIKTLTKLHADVETFSGATILGDGSVALILDIDHLIDFGRAQEERLKAS